MIATAVDEDIIADNKQQKDLDVETVSAAEAVIDAAYTDAAALLAANLIDEAALSPVAAFIANLWVVEEDKNKKGENTTILASGANPEP